MTSNWGEGQGRPWYSNDGRYMSGIDAGSRPRAWLLDTRTGRVLTQKNIKAKDEYDAKWRNGRFYIYAYGDDKPLAVLRP